jgi:CHAD domain-containing protein
MVATAVELSPASPAGALVTTTLATGSTRLRRAIGMVAAEEDDAVHQVRVACRRLRSDLRLFRRLIAGDAPGSLREELAQLALSCSQARDLEVVTALIRDHATSEDDPDYVATILTLLTTGLERATKDAEESIGGERTGLLLELLDVVAVGPELKPKADRPCSEVLPQLLADTRARFTTAAGELNPWSPDEQWHDVRLLAKRMRYTADSLSVVLGDQAREIALQAAKYQDLLGRHQDHCAAADTLWLLLDEADKTEDVEMGFALGRLMERHRAARRPLREEFLALHHRP